jgi:hypothetical protein
MASNPNDCSICGCRQNDGVRRRPSQRTGWGSTVCPRCGEYETLGLQDDSAIYKLTDEFKCALSCAARQASEGGQPLQITESNAADLAAPHLM